MATNLLPRLFAIEAEAMRRDWRADPAQWGVERLKETYWSKQRDAFAAVRDYRKVSIQSCHSVG